MERLFVLYQIGKVASTAIAENRATVDGAEVPDAATSTCIVASGRSSPGWGRAWNCA